MPISETVSVALAVNAQDGIAFDPASVRRQRYRFKAREGFGKIRLEAAVDEGERLVGVLGLDLRVATGLPERAREHRQCGRSPVQPGLEFLVT